MTIRPTAKGRDEEGLLSRKHNSEKEICAETTSEKSVKNISGITEQSYQGETKNRGVRGKNGSWGSKNRGKDLKTRS